MATRPRSRFRLPGDRASRGRGGGFRLRWILLLVGVGIAGIAWRQGWMAGSVPDPSPSSAGDSGIPRIPAGEPDPRPAVLGGRPGDAGPGGVPTNLPPDVLSPGGLPPLRIVTPFANPQGGPDPTQARPVSDVLEVQVALASHGISGGSIDGVMGGQTVAALRSFQLQQALEQTGRLDGPTRAALLLERPAIGPYTVGAADVEGLARVPDTWLGKSQVPGLPHESVLERVAERTHAHPKLLLRLNPAVDWSRLAPGAVLAVPTARFPAPRRAARIRISLSHRHLRAFDESGTLVAHFPCSIGRIAESRPVGDLHVVNTIANPNYTFDPRVFPESAEGRRLGRRLVVPPGPNNPVGVAWIGLDRPGYGIHGTPSPEQVGRTESHGCFRLANWNAEFLRQIVWVGMPISVEP